MRTSIGGSNVVSGGTASASSEYSASYSAAKAFDGSVATDNGWLSGNHAYEWLQYDFGAGNDKDIVEIVLKTPAASGSGIVSSNLPVYGVCQASDDAFAWNDVFYFGGMTQSFAQTFTFSTPKSASIFCDKLVADLSLAVFDETDKVVRVATGITQNYSSDAVRQTPFSGNYHIAGTTTNITIPVARTVRLLDQASGMLVDEITTHADGSFDFKNIRHGLWTVIGIDESAAQNSVVFSHVESKKQ